ncbi:hypothetical protein B0J15DRAFT_30236 [Fusarium solani]|uniref:Uncharacterized protein n=1 Tax=Fusarium solani TaxID=169388 RepID=A0A9P9L8Q9_FUSSL|nr:uncharacterized protein B0J15DRAFT_30236 [Fusarium solani]KAH7275973.1 hypothetical protein B0J15DRAFT_30236 [Fusarium solani]
MNRCKVGIPKALGPCCHRHELHSSPMRRHFLGGFSTASFITSCLGIAKKQGLQTEILRELDWRQQQVHGVNGAVKYRYNIRKLLLPCTCIPRVRCRYLLCRSDRLRVSVTACGEAREMVRYLGAGRQRNARTTCRRIGGNFAAPRTHPRAERSCG